MRRWRGEHRLQPSCRRTCRSRRTTAAPTTWPGWRCQRPTCPRPWADRLDLAAAARGRLVAYVYPRTGTPGQPCRPAGTTSPAPAAARRRAAPTATPRRILARSAPPWSASAPRAPAEQARVRRARAHPLPPAQRQRLRLAASSRLPTFEVDGMTLYKRLTFVAEAGKIVKVFYPVFPPDRNAAEVLAWLRQRAPGGRRRLMEAAENSNSASEVVARWRLQV